METGQAGQWAQALSGCGWLNASRRKLLVESFHACEPVNAKIVQLGREPMAEKMVCD